MKASLIAVLTSLALVSAGLIVKRDEALDASETENVALASAFGDLISADLLAQIESIVDTNIESAYDSFDDADVYDDSAPTDEDNVTDVTEDNVSDDITTEESADTQDDGSDEEADISDNTDDSQPTDYSTADSSGIVDDAQPEKTDNYSNAPVSVTYMDDGSA